MIYPILYLLFADDLKVYTDIKNVDDCKYLQTQADRINDWCNTNRLNLNINKCYVVSYCRKKETYIFDYTLNNTAISRSYCVKDLGIFFDSTFTFVNHINYMISNANKALGFILRNCKDFRDINILKILYFCFVRSKLEYGSIIWFPIYQCHIDNIESVQRRFLKYLSFKEDGIYPIRGINNQILLDRFNIASLNLRRTWSIVSFLYNLIHNNVDCDDLFCKINFLVPRAGSRYNQTFYSDRPRTNILLKAPICNACNTFNSICNNCDINFTSLNTIKNSIYNRELL